MNAVLRRHAPWVAVALAAIAVYANSIANGFAMDDPFIIQINTRVHQLADQSLIWLTPYWPNYGRELGLYRPFVIFAYALQWAAGGGAAWVFHAVNIALHAGASVLTFFLVRKFVGQAAAVAGGLVFAVHPIHTEAVANVVGQAELIAAVATLGACLIYATRPEGTATSWWRRILLVVLYALALLTKESAIVVPGLLVVLDFAQRRVKWTRVEFQGYAADAFMPMFLLLATAIGYLALRAEVLGSIGGINAAPSLPFLRDEPRIPTAFRAWPEFVRLLFYPADLSVDYAPGVILPVEGLSPMALLGAGILAVTAILAVLTPFYPASGLPAAWFLITIFPVSNLMLPIGVILAERLLYTPSLAIALIVAQCWRGVVSGVAAPRRRIPAFGLAGIVLLLMSLRTWTRNPDWADTWAVLKAMVRDHPESYRSQWTNGSLAARAGNPDLGLKYLELAYRLWPHDPQMLAEIAPIYIDRGDYQRATELLERSRDALDWVSLTRYQLAVAYIGMGQFEDALRETTAADRLGWNHASLYPLYAQAYEGLRRNDLALGAWRAAIRAPAGDLWTYRARLARLLARTGHHAEALAQADSAAAQAAPQNPAAVAVLRRLRSGIVRNCYGSAPFSSTISSASCEDPLADWRLLIPGGGVHFAKHSQNASATLAPTPSSAGEA